MRTIELSAATLAALLHDLDHASDNDLPVTLTIEEDGLKVKIGQGPWDPPLLDSDPARRPGLYRYLDLSSAVLPADEMDDIEAAPPTVIAHRDGAWVHVMDPDDWPQADPASSTPPVFPHLRAVLRVAHELGAQWVSLDEIGVDVIESLPTFDH